MMEFNLIPTFKMDKELFNNTNVMNIIKDVNNLMLEETYKGNKVSYYYEDSKNNIISYNKDICFYAASSIKILVCLYILTHDYNLEDKILITLDDIKQDTGIIKYNKEDKYFLLKELLELTLVESDNTAYIKLVNMVGKNVLREYGLSLGAKHTMEGKETDSFGIVNATDMIIYWKEVIKFINDNKNGYLLKEWLINPSFKIINDNTLNGLIYLRKYGSWDIAYHEAGYVLSNDNFYMFIFTQLNKMDYKEEFVNNIASKLIELNKIL